MRFKRGSKVEVFCTKEAPAGSWRCAEIIRGNGHKYTVMYADSIGSCGGLVLDRVPRKAIRPCPPVVEKSTVWVSGDDVEVFDCFAWKTATVLQVLSCGRYLVRLLGSLHELKVDEHDIRARLCWKGDRWVAIRRGVKNYEELKHDEQSSQKYVPSSVVVNAKANRHLNVKSFAAGITNYTQDHQAVMPRKWKRSSPFCHSARESYARPCQRIRWNGKGSMHVRFVFSQPPPAPEKVDAVASSRKRVGENYMHSSFNHRITGYPEVILESEKTDAVVGCSNAVSLESSASSVASSVGSCESCDVLRNRFYEFPEAFPREPFEDSDSQNSDAESCCRLEIEEENNTFPAEDKLREEIHRLELNAYSRILKALHASGPLSWEQETLLTNLRHSLCISSDEHLLELRNLISRSTSIPTS